MEPRLAGSRFSRATTRPSTRRSRRSRSRPDSLLQRNLPRMEGMESMLRMTGWQELELWSSAGLVFWALYVWARNERFSRACGLLLLTGIALFIHLACVMRAQQGL